MRVKKHQGIHNVVKSGLEYQETDIYFSIFGASLEFGIMISSFSCTNETWLVFRSKLIIVKSEENPFAK